MPQRTCVAVLALLVLAGCTTQPRGESYTVTTLALPEGHAEDGRIAFYALACNSCHGVAWEKDLPGPESPGTAPELDASLTELTPGVIATSIIAPSHMVPDDLRRESEGGGSPMSDLCETMTVQQLIDLVAYLRTQGAEQAGTLRQGT